VGSKIWCWKLGKHAVSHESLQGCGCSEPANKNIMRYGEEYSENGLTAFKEAEAFPIRITERVFERLTCITFPGVSRGGAGWQ
jgi:hypothetical protein